MEKYETFHKLINDAVALNLSNRPDPRRFMDSIRYAVDFCSVKIDLGRQTGKTSYIKKYASADDLWVVKNVRYKKDFARDTLATVKTFEECEVRGGRRYNNIFVDEFSSMASSSDSRYGLYAALVNENVRNQVFLLLG